MRWLILLLFLLPLAGAQEAVLSDAAGDVQGRLPSGEVVPIGAGRDLVDLRSLTVTEGPDAMVFDLGVNAYDAAQDQDSANFLVGFTFDTTEFGIHATVILAAAGGEPRASIARRPVGGEVWTDHQPALIEAITGTPALLRITVERALLTNEVGLVPVAGDRLTGFWAESEEYWNRAGMVSVVPPTGTVVWISDPMPDSLEGTGELAFTMGGEDAPEIQLTTLRPLRSSNGEEATFVYEVAITNRRTVPAEVGLSAGEPPEGWTLTVGNPAVLLQPEETRRVPVIASIPFRHDHGTTSTFTVEAHDIETGSIVSSLGLGVKFLDVPQPSGHHPTLYLHTSRPTLTLVEGYGEGFAPGPYLSAQETDDIDTSSAVGPTSTDDYRRPTLYRWCVWLSTPLLLGLDFDAADTGQFVAAMTSGLPFAGDLSARLLATTAGTESTDATSPCRPDADVIVLADMPTTAIDLAGDGAVQELDLEISPAVDVLPFVSGRRMVLELLLPVEGPAPPYNGILTDFPRFQPGAFLDLPLQEYHDAPPAFTVSATQIETTTPSRLYRNPGSAAVFNFTLATESGAFELAVVGTHPEWVRLAPSDRARDDDAFFVIVTVPEDESDGSIADLIVRAVNTKTGEIALAHAVVEVDKDESHPDDTAYAAGLAGEKSTPSLSLFALLACLVASALLRRRTPPAG